MPASSGVTDAVVSATNSLLWIDRKICGRKCINFFVYKVTHMGGKIGAGTDC
jgi:hypothetical protein